jgi:hypothetical protein
MVLENRSQSLNGPRGPMARLAAADGSPIAALRRLGTLRRTVWVGIALRDLSAKLRVSRSASVSRAQGGDSDAGDSGLARKARHVRVRRAHPHLTDQHLRDMRPIDT